MLVSGQSATKTYKKVRMDKLRQIDSMLDAAITRAAAIQASHESLKQMLRSPKPASVMSSPKSVQQVAKQTISPEPEPEEKPQKSLKEILEARGGGAKKKPEPKKEPPKQEQPRPAPVTQPMADIITPSRVAAGDIPEPPSLSLLPPLEMMIDMTSGSGAGGYEEVNVDMT